MLLRNLREKKKFRSIQVLSKVLEARNVKTLNWVSMDKKIDLVLVVAHPHTQLFIYKIPKPAGE